jgi:Ca2+-binding EF-hand superfamily protein
MKARIVSMVAALSVSAFGGSAHAQGVDTSNQRLRRLMERFHQADANGDGHLTRDEAQKGIPRVYEHFSEIDSDHKGYVTLDQITAFMESHPGLRARGAPPVAAP